jgi:hypothetical protein
MTPVSRIFCILILLMPTVGCATSIHISSDYVILKEESAHLPPVNSTPFSVSIEIEVPTIATARKPGRVGEPRNLSLDYAAYQLLSDVAQICAQRRFSGTTLPNERFRLLIKKTDVVYDEYTDTFAWRPVIEVNIEAQAIYGSDKSFSKNYSSGRLKGDWKRSTTERNEQYTRLIYRAMLIVIEKAMADLAQRVTAL